MTPSPSIADRMTAALMLALAAAELAHQVAGVAVAGPVGRLLALALVLAVMPRFGVREWFLLGLALALSAGLWSRGDGTEVVRALESGAYFAAFILLMMLLREAALTSASVLAVGRWMTLQPPGRRFVATWIGGHVAGVLMNFGAVSLLAPLVQRGVRAGPMETEEDRRRALIRERRQLSALIRGFSWVIAWAPTTLTQVIIFANVPGLHAGKAILMGLALSAIMLVVGWSEDRWRWGRPRIAAGGAGPFPRRAGLDLVFVYALLIGGAWTVQHAVGTGLPQALMTTAPLMLVGWLACQADVEVGPRLRQIALTAIPRMARDAMTLGTAGFIGIAAASLAPVEAIARWTEAAHIPAWLLVAGLPAMIVLAGQVALSPMMMVVFLAGVISALPVLPAEPEVIAIALGAGWALSMTAAPNASGAILISGATGIPATTMTWAWNGVYSLTALGVLIGLAWALVP